MQKTKRIIAKIIITLLTGVILLNYPISTLVYAEGKSWEDRAVADDKIKEKETNDSINAIEDSELQKYARENSRDFQEFLDYMKCKFEISHVTFSIADMNELAKMFRDEYMPAMKEAGKPISDFYGEENKTTGLDAKQVHKYNEDGTLTPMYKDRLQKMNIRP